MVLDIKLKRLAEEVLETSINDASIVGGGRNSRVYQLETSHGPFVLKHYHGTQRLDVEFAAFKSLREAGLTTVPEVIYADRGNSFAIYECIQGEPVTQFNIVDRDITDCIKLIRDLNRVSRSNDSTESGDAAEAFFCLSDIEKNINDRLNRLEGRERNTGRDIELDQFLSDEFKPGLHVICERAHKIYDSLGLSVEQVIPISSRVLSPSDFGFHNSLRTEKGMSFFDFEYFGWDDPAKLISDFLLHPGMDISSGKREQFGAGVIKVMNDPLLSRRLEALLPVFGLKWCMILLNEFLNTDLARREFAGVVGERDELLHRQLDKARAMLAQALAYSDTGITFNLNEG